MGLNETLNEATKYEIIFDPNYDTPNVDKKQFYINPEHDFNAQLGSLIRQMVMISPVYLGYTAKRINGFRDQHEENSIATLVENLDLNYGYVRTTLMAILKDRLEQNI